MIVSDSNIQLAAQHRETREKSEFERLEVFTTDGQGQVLSMSIQQQDKISLSEEAQSLSEKAQRLSEEARSIPLTRDPAPVRDAFNFDNELSLDIRTQAMKGVIEGLFGLEIKLGNGQRLAMEPASSTALQADILGTPLAEPQAGMRYQAFSYYQEAESLEFQAKGAITLADGRQLDINLEMIMQRDFVSSESLTIEAGAKLKDPLVVNFASSSAQLTEQKYDFDLDADGKKDNISFAGPGSGLLMLDSNLNGRADNGNELFGARTGNGFSELAQYDDDKNGFIDEGDAVYSQLKLWVKSPEGQDQYFSLAEKDVGAIYLGAIDTQFSFKDSQNTQQGQLRSTSLYLNEQGGSGTVQQVDLVV